MESSQNHDDTNQPLQESIPSDPENKEPQTLPSSPLPAICKHPIFKLINDELLSHILQPVQFLLVPSQNADKHDYSMALPNFGDALARPLSSDPEAVKILRTQGSSDKTICGKHITLGDIYVRCLDCDLSNSPSVIALMCINCFERSNHKGHRIVMGTKSEKSSATCDCGDREFLNSEGFCPDHQPKEIDLEAIFKNFPKNILEGFQVNIKKALYLVASLFEMGFYARSEQLANRLLSLGDVVLKEVLEFGVYCYTEINENFLHILGHVLQTGFLEDAGELWHNCEDFAAEENPQEVDTEKGKMCKCTAAGNLLRLGSDIGKPQQELVEKVLTECVKYPKFKEFMVVEFLKYIQFQYILGNTNSTILNMKFQLFVSDNCQEVAIESPHFQNLVQVISKVFKTSNQQISNGVDKIIWDVWNSFNYFLSSQSRITKRILQEGNFLKDLLDLLIQFQGKFFYPGPIQVGIHEHNVAYQSINANLVIEKAISQGIEKSIFLICRLFPGQKAALLKNVAVHCYLSLKLVNKTINYNEPKASITFTPGLQRVFCSLIKAFLGSNISLEGLLGMIEELIPSTKPCEVADETIQGVLKTVGMVRYLHLMHNFTSGQLWMVYYFIPGVTFQRDIFLIQMMTMIADPGCVFKKIVESFFSYNAELQEFFDDPCQLVINDHYK